VLVRTGLVAVVLLPAQLVLSVRVPARLVVIVL
jgi:hypothetical protein